MDHPGLHYRLAELAHTRGASPAFLFLRDGENDTVEISYAGLYRRAAGIARALAGHERQPVLLLLPPGLDYVAALLGCFLARAIAVPAYPPLSKRMLPRVLGIRRDCGARLALTTRLTQQLVAGETGVESLRWLPLEDIADESAPAGTPAAGDTADVALLQYTSGSTSEPKGVVLTHANIMANQAMIRRAFGHDQASVILSWLPPYHDMGLIGGVLHPLFLGERGVLMSPFRFAENPLRWLQAIQRYGVTTTGGPNFAYDLCVEKIPASARAGLDLKSWRVAFNGAEPVRHGTMARFAEAFGPAGFSTRSWFPCYGLAEATLIATGGHWCGQPLPADRAALAEGRLARAAPLQATPLVGSGPAVEGVDVLVVDPKRRVRLADGDIGEIWIRGPAVARGYWNAAFPSGRLPGSRPGGVYLRTGDLGAWVDGELYVTGRLKDVLIVRGKKYSPSDIEAAAQQCSPELRRNAGAAFAVGTGDLPRIVLVQELRPRAAKSDPELAGRIRRAVYEEHQVTVDEVCLVPAGAVPRTSSGKIRRAACRELYLSGRFDRLEAAAKSVTPGQAGGGAEDGLLGLWREVLEAPGLGADASFFAEGGDSLQALRLLGRLKEVTGRELTLADLLAHDSAGAMTAWLAASQANEQAPARRAEPIPLASREAETFPVTDAQRALWALAQRPETAAVYNLVQAYAIAGALDPAALERALARVVERYEVLRTTFGLVEGEVRQRIAPTGKIALERMTGGDLRAVAAAELARPFDLENGPLLRVSVLELAPAEWGLVFAAPHIVMDGTSVGKVLAELASAYAAAVRSEALPPAPALPVQYRDYAAWQERRLTDGTMESSRRYWRERMAGELPVLDLPLERPRPAVRRHRGGTVRFDFARDEVSALRTLAAGQEATLFMVLLAGWQALLHRYTGQCDLIVGVPVDGRYHPMLADQVGYYVGMLPLRSQPERTMPFAALVQAVKRAVLDGHAHQDYPLDRLIADLALVRDPSRQPLFDTMVAMDQDWTAWSLSGLEVLPLKVDAPSSRYDLALLLTDGGDRLQGALEYDSDLFVRERIERLVTHFRQLLQSAAQAPRKMLAELDLFGGEERAHLLGMSRGPVRTVSSRRCLHECFQAQVQATPGAIAVVYEGQSLTYAQLNARANQLARRLQKEGVGREHPVGVLTDRSLAMPVALLAIIKAGAAYLPLDPAYPAERMAYMLDDSGCRLVLAQENHREKLTGFKGRVIAVDDPALYQGSADDLPATVGPGGLVYVMYTSGSTGKPKGTMVTHAAVVSHLTWLASAYRIDARDVILQKTTYTFDPSVWELFLGAVTGAKVCFLKAGAEADMAAVAQTLRAQEITTVVFVPSVLGLFLQQLEEPTAFPRLKRVMCCGEALTLEHKRLFFEKIPSGVQLRNLYGPTEVTIVVSDHEVKPEDTAISIGRPVADTQFYIVDAWLQPVPVGVPGELCLAGAQLARGYLGRPELTAEKFVANPQAAGERMYRTGDLARWLPDGTVDFLGRADSQVKIHGQRIELGEIEAALRQHPQVAAAAVVARMVGGEKTLCAYVVAPAALETEALRTHLRRQLPGYMVPSSYTRLEAMPLNSSGKIDRKRLPEPDRAGGKQAYAAPRDEAEAALAVVWGEVLKATPVGIDDDYFLLGGDSIKAIQVAARLRSRGYKLEMAALFREPTIRRLAPHVGKAVEAIDQAEVTGKVAVTPIQAWFLAQELAERSHWNQAMMIGRTERFDVPALATVLARWVEHHDLLRAVLKPDGLEVLPAPAVRVTPTVTKIAGDNWQAQVQAAANAVQAGFDLERGPLFKVAVYQTPVGDYLQLVAHHLVIDGVSWRILLEDLEQGYAQMQKGEPIRFAAKTVSFQRWAERLRQHAQSAAIRRELGYWRSVAASASTLPGQPRAATLADQQTITVELDEATSRALAGPVHRAYGTEINDVLLGALAQALGEWTKQEQNLIALEGHGREELGLEVTRTVGWFTSLYPVALRREEESGRQLCTTKESLRQVPHKGIGYGLLRYLTELTAEERQGIAAQPEVTFNYLGQVERPPGTLPELSAGALVSRKNRLLTPLSFNGLIVDGRLRFTMDYDAVRFTAQEAEQLAALYREKLTALVLHALAAEQRTYTGSDFGRPGLPAEELAGLKLAELERIVEPTPLQRGIYFHGLMEEGGSAYKVQLAFEVTGEFQPEVFARSLTALQARHEALRSSFALLDAQLCQLVWKPRAAVVETVANDKSWEQLLACEHARPFDLQAGSLFRAVTVTLGAQRTGIIFGWHHLILDGWSIARLLHELFTLYGGLAKAAEPALPAPWPLANYTRWLETKEPAAVRRFWSDYLADYEKVMLEGWGAAKPDYELQERRLELGGDFTRQLRAVAAAQQVTESTLLQVAWGLVLQRYKGASDVVFGNVISGRSPECAGVEQAVGLFVNTVPVRMRETAGAPVAEALRRRQAESLAGEASGLLPLAELPGGAELVDHLFVFENYPVEENLDAALASAGGLRIEGIHNREHTHYTLNLMISSGKELAVRFVHDERALPADAVRRLAAHYEKALRAIVANPALRLGEIDLVDDAEAQRLLVEFNATAAEYPREHCLHELFEAQVRQRPEAIAAVYEGASLTFAQLNARANQLARRLQREGAKPDQRIALVVERSLEMMVGILGVLKAGAAYLPVDPQSPAERIEFLLRDAGCGIALVQRAHRPGVNFGGVTLELDDAALYAGEATNLPRACAPHHLAYVIYTSGSTGRPKGVMVAHGGVVNRLEWMRREYAVGPEDVILQKTNYTFDVSVWELLQGPVSGARTCFLKPGGEKDPGEISRVMLTQGATLVHFVPSMFDAFLAVMEPGTRFPRWRQCCCSGEALTAAQKDLFFARTGGAVRLLNLYGPTEASIEVSAWPVQAAERTVPIGRPVANTQLYILDERLRPAPVGIVGNLYLGGVQLARGYLHRPELTAEKFVANPFRPGERMYLTGDLAWWRADGAVEFVGRKDSQVKIRGFRVELGEIEAALRQHPQVAAAAVMARVVAGEKTLCAYIVAPAVLETEALRAHLRRQLPGYMVPASYTRLEAMPLNSSGKIDRKRLPEPDRAGGKQAYAAPRDEAEAALAAVWGEVLKTTPVGIDDDYFLLGGDSIKAIQVAARLRSRGYKLEMAALFREPTIRRLAPHVGKAVEAIDQAEVTGKVTFTPIQAWFMGQELAERAHWNQGIMIGREDRFDEQALNRVLARLVEHHDLLRAVVRPEGLAVLPTQAVTVTPTVTKITGDNWPAQVEAAANAVQGSFDLERGPLFKVAVYQTPVGDYLQLVAHHLVIDGVSWRILLEDLEQGLAQARKGEPIRFAAKTVSFQRWAERLRQYAQSAAIRRELDYWRSVAASASTLPGQPRAATLAEQQTIIIEWDEATSRALAGPVHRAYGTEINDVLLGALAQALGEWTKQEQNLIALEGHGREELGLEVTRTVGWFTSLYPVALRREEEPGRQLCTTKEDLRQVPHKGIGYGLLRYLTELNAEERQAIAVEPEVTFNYLGQVERPATKLPELSAGEAVGGKNRLITPLNFNGLMVDGRLRFTMGYDAVRFTAQEAGEFAALYQEKLTALVRHAQSVAQRIYTGSDFGRPGLAVEELAGLKLAELERIVEPTPLQRGIYFHGLMEEGGSAYKVQLAFEVMGEFQPELFARSLTTLQARHEALRSSFALLDAQLCQLVWKPRAAVVETATGDQNWEQLLARDYARSFDLQAGPLLRAVTVTLGPKRTGIILGWHHLILDGWSIARLLHELFTLYGDLVKAAEPALPAPWPLANYTRWLETKEPAAVRRFWSDYLAGCEKVTLEGWGTAKPGYALQEHRLELGGEFTRQLRAAAAAQQVTESTLLQVAWGVVLQRYKGAQDVIYGNVISGRSPECAGVEQAVGLFINTVPVRMRETAHTSVVEALRRRQAEALAGEAMGVLPLVELPGGAELVDHLFIFENYPIEEDLGLALTPAGGLGIKGIRNREHTHYTLNLMVSAGRELTVRFVHDARALPADAIQRLAGHYERVVHAIVANPALRLGEIDLVEGAEARRLLVEFNATAADYPRERSLHACFQAQVRAAPEAIAVVYEGQSLTYAQLNARANRLARRLQKEGVICEHPVGVLTDRSLAMPVTLLAIIKAGAAYLPLDPAYPADRIAYMLGDSGCRLVLVQENHREKLTGFAGRILDVDDPALDQGSADDLPVSARPDSLMYVMYTSGSTGRPKGTMVTHRAVVNHLTWLASAYAIEATDVVLQKTTYTFDLSVWELFLGAVTGAKVCFLKAGAEADMAAVAQALRDYEITTVVFVPSVLGLFLSQLEGPTAFPRLKRVMCCGEALTLEHKRLFFEKLLGGAQLRNLYGPTEATIAVSDHEVKAGDTLIPIGKPVANTQFYIVDAWLQPVPVGVYGELCLAGAQLARGYLHRPELTAEKFIANPYVAGERMYRTGDLARWLPDGTVDFLGRADTQVKIHGHRIELGEIEAVLRQHPQVAQAAVVARPVNGSTENSLCAYYVPREKTAAPSRPLAFSLFYFSGDGAAKGSDKYRLLLEGAKFADANGFEAVWTPERHFHAFGGLFPNPSVLGAALAAATRRVAIRAGSVVLPLHDPIRVAEEWAVVDNLSRGRVGLAFASGWHPRDFVFAPERFKERRAHLRTGLETVRTLWSGGTVTRTGGDGAPTTLKILPRPLQAQLPVWITAGGAEETFRFAGETGANVLTHLLGQSLDDLERKIQVYRKAWDEAGHAPGGGRVTLMVHTFIGDDLEAVRAQVRGPFLDYLKSSTDLAASMAKSLGVNARPEDEAALYEHAFARYFETSGLMGTPDSCEATIRRLQALGVDEVACLVDFGVPCDTVLASLARLKLVKQRTEQGVPAGEPAPGAAPARRTEALRRHLASRLPGYMVPVYFTELDALPLTTNGKTDRKRLPEPAAAMAGRAYSPPATEGEVALARLFGGILGVKRVGLDDDFFELGGHSLKAIQFTAQLRKELRVELALKELFSHPTVRRLAPLLHARKGGAFAAIPPAAARPYYPATSAQRRMFALQQLHGGVAYNIPALYRLSGPLDLGRLERAMSAVVRRHEALRTCFELRAGEVVQRVVEPRPFAVLHLEPGRADPRERMREFIRPFDLGQPTLLRIGVAREGKDEHLLCIDLHHIIADLASTALVMRDFARAYAGEPLPPTPLHYKDYAVWQEERLRGAPGRRQEAYWLKQLENEPPVLNLLTDFPRPLVPDFEGGHEDWRLDGEQAQAVRLFCEREAVTPYMLFLAAYFVLLGRYGDQDDIVLGMSAAGRDHPDLEEVVGMFVNPLALRSAPRNEKSFAGYLQEVKTLLLEGLEFQSYPFERLLEKVRGLRDPARNPLFNVLFVMDGAVWREQPIRGLRIERQPFEFNVARFDLTLRFQPDAGDFAFTFDYRSGLFLPETIRAMARHYRQILQQAIQAPGRRLGAIALMDEAEQKLVEDYDHA